MNTPRAGPAGPEAFARACLRLRRAPEQLEAVRAAAGSLAGEWETLRALADAEGLAPLLHHTAGNRGLLPEDIAVHVRREYRLSALRNRILLHELGACLRAFAAARLRVIVLKGAALVEAVYRDVALRPMVDLDLLVHPRDRASAQRLLESQGYAASRPEVRPGALAEQESEIDFCKTAAIPLHVDLHWSLFDSPHYQRRIDPNWFWDTAGPARIAGEPALILGLEAQVLHLSGHLALHHAGRGLRWWEDLAAMLAADADRLDWDELLTRARRYDLQLALRSVLMELAEHWDAPVPAAVVAALRAVQPSPEETWVAARMAAPHRSAGQRFWADLVSISDWNARRRFALANLFPSAAYMRARYAIRHPLLLPLYYPYRWLRGLFGA